MTTPVGALPFLAKKDARLGALASPLPCSRGRDRAGEAVRPQGPARAAAWQTGRDAV